MKRVFKYLTLVLMVALTFTLSGCKGYNADEIITIQPSQTAFLVPLDGDSGDQVKFDSEESLEVMKVATKRVTITHRWHKTGYLPGTGEWVREHELIIVERKPETREWTATEDTGTSSLNQGIRGESIQSISFSVSMNVSAQIDEENAAKFLYRYNNKPLAEIMDEELRARIEGRFVEEVATRTMTQILAEKGDIMDSIRADIIPYFAERGVTINDIALKGDIVYDDPAIQEAINLEFIRIKEQEAQLIQNATDEARALTEKSIAETKAEQDKSVQETINEMNIAKAEAEAAVIIALADADREALQMEILAYSTLYDGDGNPMMTQEAVEAYLSAAYYAAWDGSVPQTILDEVLSTFGVTQPNTEDEITE